MSLRLQGKLLSCTASANLVQKKKCATPTNIFMMSVQLQAQSLLHLLDMVLNPSCAPLPVMALFRLLADRSTE